MTPLEHLTKVATPYLPGAALQSLEEMANYDASVKVPGTVEVEVYPFILALCVVFGSVRGATAAREGDFMRCMAEQGYISAAMHSLAAEWTPGELTL